MQLDKTKPGESPTSNNFLGRLRGVLLPFTTPYTDADTIDKGAITSNIVRWNGTGVSGYVALGSTGERVHLSEQECMEVIETARSAVPSHMNYIVGAGQQSTRGTIEEARRFASAGADALLVITPHFYRATTSQDQLITHYAAVADASPVPVVLYSVPDLTGVSLAANTVSQLAKHENIIGIKDSSADVINLSETLRLVPEEFAVFTGNGGLLFTALGLGARGGILAVGCVAPKLSVKIYEAALSGDQDNARSLQRKLTPLARAVTVRFGIGGLKAALSLIGLKGGTVRPPLPIATKEAQIEISRLLEEAGVIGDNVPQASLASEAS